MTSKAQLVLNMAIYSRTSGNGPTLRSSGICCPYLSILAALLAQGAVSLVVPKGIDFPYAFFYLIAVFAVAWFGGYAPGVVACLLTSGSSSR